MNIDEIMHEVILKIDEKELIELHQQSIRIPSVTGNESEYANFIADKMREYGFDDVELYEFKPNRFNVLGIIQGDGDGKSLMFASHLDTVDVLGWKKRWSNTNLEDPFNGNIINGEIWGRGSVDMKAGITAELIACKAIKKAGINLKGNILVSATGDEENYYSDGIKSLVSKIRTGKIPSVDFGIWTDPSDGFAIYISQWGFLQGNLSVFGKESYVGTPWLGVNAITQMNKFIIDLLQYSEKIWFERWHRLEGRPYVLIYHQEGGRGTLGVPDYAHIKFWRVVLPNEDMDEVISEIEGLIGARAIRDGIQYVLQWGQGRDHQFGGLPIEVNPDHDGIRTLARVVSKVTGEQARITGAPYWGEIGFLVREAGIPFVYCGPGRNELCHTLEERISIQDLIRAAHIYASMIVAYCCT